MLDARFKIANDFQLLTFGGNNVISWFVLSNETHGVRIPMYFKRGFLAFVSADIAYRRGATNKFENT